ncbi:ABC transporter permease [Arthrobacter roseus]|uniref:ABC transporter permease n=1 Tax=Arthrobacter roseus TaxID=136274 RepID=UPI001964B362|nr:ABC transporter permease subunit [Arthrobacter roseus]MBM7846935.1 ABC-type transport system involved in multi-copper enzyme maturation permease subunit [Arthrobacter roseus]
MTAQLKENDIHPQHSLSWIAGVKAVFKLEMKQRLRARSWYIVLGIWFALLGLIFVLAAVTTASMNAEGEGGPILFELVIGTVLLFGLLVAPGLSATAINGDRAAGTLAIIQITLLTPGQVLWGKWLTAWAAALAFLVISLPFIVWALIVGGVSFSETLVSLVMLAVELGLVAAIGVGVSAIAARPLFSIVITYMLVALLSIGTLIGFGLSMVLVQEEAEVTTANYSLPDDFDSMAEPKDEDFTCTTETYRQPVLHTERTAWLLAANPFVIVADSVPYNRVSEEDSGTAEDYRVPGVMESVSLGLRTAQAGPDFEQTCEELSGPYAQSPPPTGLMPIWPLGLALQALLAGALILIGWKRLATPAGRLPRGTRIA